MAEQPLVSFVVAVLGDVLGNSNFVTPLKFAGVQPASLTPERW
ncbi:MAG: hypothetical protein ACRDTV_00280 [Mycobacterium sp.]